MEEKKIQHRPEIEPVKYEAEEKPISKDQKLEYIHKKIDEM